ncbi:hypothetical protein [Helicobacter rodentium]|uniref:hypothetical protein n=1 Tax=Helicobacter rodentium TaxID=59617 RepID=UPI0025727734|nr:hypothetical protein [Helicobacter rodentium]
MNQKANRFVIARFCVSGIVAIYNFELLRKIPLPYFSKVLYYGLLHFICNDKLLFMLKIIKLLNIID